MRFTRNGHVKHNPQNSMNIGKSWSTKHPAGNSLDIQMASSSKGATRRKDRRGGGQAYHVGHWATMSDKVDHTFSLSCSQCLGFIPGFRRATMAGTFGRKAETLSLMTLQMLLWATFPLLSKTRDAFWIAVPSLHGEIPAANRSKAGAGSRADGRERSDQTSSAKLACCITVYVAIQAAPHHTTPHHETRLSTSASRVSASIARKDPFVHAS